MIRNKKAMLFCSQIILTGALITGAPCLASGAEIEVAEEDGTSGSVFGSSATTADSEEVDHSGEGQIHKPSSLEVPDFTSDPDFVDDSTDNTYGYYTIMGDTTVSLAQMTSQYEEHGAEYLHQMLEKVDAASAKAIHPNNVKRVIRALEFYEKTGRTISSHNEQEREKESPYNAAYFVLNDDRNEIYRRIDQRVDQMMQAGLIEEVRRLKDMGYTKDMVSMQGLGYKEILDYLDGNTTLEEAVYILKRDTRHFAKRQLTWFRREHEVIWVEKEKFSHDNGKILDFMKKELTERGIL